MSEDFRKKIEQIKGGIAIISHKHQTQTFSSSVAHKRNFKKNSTQLSQTAQKRELIFFWIVKKFLSKNFVPKNENNFKFFNPTPKKHYDLAISLDCSNIERMGKYVELFQKADKTVNIDHHATNTRFANAKLIILLKTSSNL